MPLAGRHIYLKETRVMKGRAMPGTTLRILAPVPRP